MYEDFDNDMEIIAELEQVKKQIKIVIADSKKTDVQFCDECGVPLRFRSIGLWFLNYCKLVLVH